LAAHVHPLNQRIQVWRIAVRSDLNLKRASVSSVLVAVNGVAHLPQSVPEFPFTLALDGDSRQRNCHPGQDDEDRGRDDQFDQREATFAMVGSLHLYRERSEYTKLHENSAMMPGAPFSHGSARNRSGMPY